MRTTETITDTTERLPRRTSSVLLSAIVVVVATATLFGPLGGIAEAATYRSHGTMYCSAGYMKVIAPRQVYSSPAAQVWWKPTLWRWDGAAWRLVDDSRGWYTGVATPNGMVDYGSGLWNKNGFMTMFVPYSVPRGSYYAVTAQFWGGPNGWVKTSTGGTYCYA